MWGFGCFLIELFGRSRPYSGQIFRIDLVIEGALRPTIHESTPPLVAELIERLLSLTPEARPPIATWPSCALNPLPPRANPPARLCTRVVAFRYMYS